MKIKFVVLCFLLVFATTAWAALPVTDGLVIHLEAGSINGVSDGNPISEWTDQSGAGNHATQTTAGYQPLYIASEAVFSGFSVVRFDGIDDYLNLPSGTSCPINVGSFTVFAVAKFDRLDVSQYICSGQGSSGDDRLRMQIDVDATGDPFLWRAGSSSWTAITSAPADTDKHIFGFTSDLAGTGLIEGYLDGESVGTASNTSSLQPSDFMIGVGGGATYSWMTGDIAEFVVFNRPLTALEYEEVNEYLYDKYWLGKTPRGPELVYPVGVENLDDYTPTLQWNAPEEFTPAHYYIYLDPNQVNINAITKMVEPDPASPLHINVSQLGTEPNEYTIPGAKELAPGTRYYWKVEGYDAAEPNYYSSSVATFTTLPDEPTIIDDPDSQTVPQGDPVTLSVVALDPDNQTYKWYKDGIAIDPPETNPDLVIASMAIGNEGYYYCNVSNSSLPAGIDSGTARLMMQRRVALWTFDNANLVSDVVTNENSFTGVYFDPNDSASAGPQFSNAAPSPAGSYYMVFSGDTAESEGDNYGETVMVEPNEFFNFYPLGFTASAWVKITGRTDLWTGYLSKHDRLVTQSYPIGWTMLKNPDNNAVVAARGTTSTWADTVGTSDITLVNEDTGNTWHLVTGTYDGSVSRIYVDGNLETTSASSTYVMPENSMPLAIGAETPDGYAPLDGHIDNVEVYNYPLSRYDVAKLYVDDVPGAEICIEDVVGVSDDMDFNDDCIVDIKDLAAFAQDWLDCYIVPTCIL